MNLFPKIDNIKTGDVAFHPSVAVNDDSLSPSISLHAIEANYSQTEANAIIKLIKNLQKMIVKQALPC